MNAPLTSTEWLIVSVDTLQIVCLILAGLGIVAVRAYFTERHLWLSLCGLIILLVLRRFDDIGELLHRPLLDPLPTAVFSSAAVGLVLMSVWLIYRSERRRRELKKTSAPRIAQLEALFNAPRAAQRLPGTVLQYWERRRQDKR